MASEGIFWTLMGVVVTAQTISSGDWTNMASLPFAFAAASFLIWSMVKLCGMLFDAWQKQAATTIETLRGQVSSLQTAQSGQMTEMHRDMKELHERSAAAIVQNNDAIAASVKAWNEVHEDLKEMIGHWKARPCLLEQQEKQREWERSNGPRNQTRDRPENESPGGPDRT